MDMGGGGQTVGGMDECVVFGGRSSQFVLQGGFGLGEVISFLGGLYYSGGPRKSG